MTVLRDDGLYRHVRFRDPALGFCMQFDIITWPEHLCYTGDMGTYVFSRIDDMFQFFRREPDGNVALGYWAEKCISSDRDGLKEFLKDALEAAVKADYDDFVDRENLSDEDKVGLWEEIKYEILKSSSIESAIDAASRFRFLPHGGTHQLEVFPDFWESNLEGYTPRFVWCCFALPWAIAKYDAAKASVESAKALQDNSPEP
jgi:hypothetical protein